jgi:hypothetical protein
VPSSRDLEKPLTEGGEFFFCKQCQHRGQAVDEFLFRVFNDFVEGSSPHRDGGIFSALF